jgi:Killing trait
MAFPTFLNGQITDSIAQANTKVLGDAPAIAMGDLYQATARALANEAQYATSARPQTYVTSQASTTMGEPTFHALDTAAGDIATHIVPNPPSRREDLP